MDLRRLTQNAFRIALLFVFVTLTQKYTTFLFICTCLAIKEKYITVAFTGMVMSLLLPSPYSLFNALVYSVTVLPLLCVFCRSSYSVVTVLLWSLIYNIATLIPKMVVFMPETLVGEESIHLTIAMISTSMFLTMYLWDEIEREVERRFHGRTVRAT